MFITLQRILKSGVRHFWRNGWLSTATVSVMALALSVILGLILLSVLSETLIGNLQNKVDVSVYFKSGVQEAEIQKVKNDISVREEVRSVSYTSEEEALTIFTERYKSDALISQVLKELDDNPLEASLNIKAQDPSKFISIVSFLEDKKYQEIISKINYYENKNVIEALTAITSAVRRTGFFISAVLSLVAVLVSFNTIHMAIYALKDEIGVMKLVGASNWLVRGPFLVAGVLYGVVASLVTMLAFYPMMFLVTPYVSSFFPGTNLFVYFQDNFILLWSILAITGIMLGVFGSAFAMRKHLKM